VAADRGARAALGGRPGGERGHSRSHLVLRVEDGRDDVLHLPVARPRHPVHGLPQRGEGGVDVEPERLLHHPDAEQVAGPAGGEERRGGQGTRTPARPGSALHRPPGAPRLGHPGAPQASPLPSGPRAAIPAEHAPDLLQAVARHGGASGRASPSNAATLATAPPSNPAAETPSGAARARSQSPKDGGGRWRPGSTSRWPRGGVAGSCPPPQFKGPAPPPPTPPPP